MSSIPAVIEVTNSSASFEDFQKLERDPGMVDEYDGMEREEYVLGLTP